MRDRTTRRLEPMVPIDDLFPAMETLFDHDIASRILLDSIRDLPKDGGER